MASKSAGFLVDAVSAAWFLPDEANPRTEAALQATALDSQRLNSST